jgi:tape measure domain-containing protein
MAKNKLDILLGLDNAQLKTKLKESQGLLKSFKTSLGGVLGGAALGISLKNLGDYALNASKAFESASISFKVLLGNEEKAAKLVKDIEALANVTPMSSSGLQENAKLLLNFNAVAEDEIIPTLTMLGDITGGNQAKMDSMTLAFAQCASAGRLMGQDLLQMINAGFNPLQIISEKTGKSIATLKEEMSDGKISVEMVTQAFKDATAEGGRFYGMMKEQSESKAGLEATKADSYEILARTIADRAIPALKDFDKAQIKAANSATEHVKTLYKWMDVNNQTLNMVKNTSIALVTIAGAFAATKQSVALASAAIEYFRYQQALARTETTALALAMQGKLVLATKALIVQFRTLTATMLANPWTWVAVAIAGVVGAVVHLKNESEKTAAIIADLNNKEADQVSTLSDAITTIKELSGAENLNYEEKQKLTNALALLTDKYPEYADRLREELALKGEINKATAEEIANKLTLQKINELEKRKKKVEKVINARGNYATFESIDGTTGFAYEDEKTKEYNRLQKEIYNALESKQSIVNTLTGVDSSTPTKGGKKKATAGMSKADKTAAEKAQKEALALKLAQLDAELLLVKNNAEESHKIELQKIQAKLNSEKKGTSEYQNILNERTKLEQEYADQAIQLEIERYNRKAELEQLQIDKQRSALDSQNESGSISSSDYYKEIQALEDQKYNIALAGLQKQEELYKDDLAKLEQINHEKLVLTANYELAKQELVTESLEAENERWRNVLEHLGESFQDSLGEFFQGNQTLKESFINIFGDIKAAFARMIAEMLVEQAKLTMLKGLTNLAGAGGWVGTAANFIKGFFADGGIVPGNYNQAVPIVAHGSEMVLNPTQQKNLWNMVAGATNTQTSNQGATGQSQQVIVNNITPVFQSLDPAQGQKMFTDWMKQSGVPIVKDSIKNNNHQMRDMIKGV